MSKATLLAMLLCASAATAQDLPLPGPPPDPSRGETFDGRPRAREPVMRTLTLAAPRVVFYPVRLLLRALRPPFLWAFSFSERREESARRAFGPRPRYGVTPILRIGGDTIFAAGARVWASDLFGPGTAVTSATAAFGGTGYYIGALMVVPNPALPIGAGGRVEGRHRSEEPFWGVAGAELDDPLHVHSTVVDVDARLVLRPGGLGGRWRGSLLGAFGTRRFSDSEEDELLDLAVVPGFENGATFVRSELALEHVSLFDVSRRRPGLDLLVSMAPTVGVASGDDSRYVTGIVEAAWGLPIGGGRAFVLRGRAGDQESFGDDPVDFYDLLYLGGNEWLRGFDTYRFRGSSLLAASIDFRTPLLMWLDLDLFADVGNTYEEHWEGISSEGVHVATGGELRMFSGTGMRIRLLAAWGFGDGLRAAVTVGGPE